MATIGEDRVGSELRACRESLGQIRNELSGSLGQFELQVSGLRESLSQTQQSYRDLQAKLDQVQEGSTDLEIQVQAVRNLDLRLEQAESAIQNLESVELTAPAPAPAEGIDPRALNSAIRALSAGTSQEEILEGFLEQVSKRVGRAILFANQDGQFIAWSTKGFPEEAIESVVVEDQNDPIMTVARSQKLIYREQAPAEARPSLGQAGELPHAFVAIPLVFDAYVPVILYADSDTSIDVDYLEVLSYLAVLMLKNNALQHLVNEPPRPAESAAPSGESAAAVVSETEEPAPAALEQATQEMPTVAEMPSPLELAVPEAWEIPESMRDEGHPGREPQPEPPPPLVEEPEVSFQELQQTLEQPVEEPAPLPELEPEPAPEPEAEQPPVSSLSPEEDEKFNNEARRFARLLVSEIKLYNEDEVYNGRQNADLYLRLKRDIDRSRDMYEKRVHPAVAASADHFDEELIRILAREDRNLMGAGYPGPTLRKS
jgi:hypothetical protein